MKGNIPVKYHGLKTWTESIPIYVGSKVYLFDGIMHAIKIQYMENTYLEEYPHYSGQTTSPGM